MAMNTASITTTERGITTTMPTIMVGITITITTARTRAASSS